MLSRERGSEAIFLALMMWQPLSADGTQRLPRRPLREELSRETFRAASSVPPAGSAGAPPVHECSLLLTVRKGVTPQDTGVCALISVT